MKTKDIIFYFQNKRMIVIYHCHMTISFQKGLTGSIANILRIIIKFKKFLNCKENKNRIDLLYNINIPIQQENMKVGIEKYFKEIFAALFPIQQKPTTIITIIFQILVNQSLIFSIEFLNEFYGKIQITSNQAIILYYTFTALRIVTLVLFLIIKNPILIYVDRFCITLLFIVSKNNILMRNIDIGLLALQAICILSLTLIHNKSFKNNSFAGRLFLKPYFFHELCLVLLSFTPYIPNQDRKYFIISLLGLRLWLISKDIIYNLRYKQLLIYLQIGNICIQLTKQFCKDQLNILIMIIIFSIFGYLGQRKCNYCIELNIRDKQKLANKTEVINDQELFKYFILLNYLIYENKYVHIIQFVQNHKKHCHDLTCPLMYVKSNLPQEQLVQSEKQQLTKALDLYFRKQLTKYKKINKSVFQLIIFLTLPSIIAFKYMDQNNWIHYRILQKSNGNFDKNLSIADIEYMEIQRINSKIQHLAYSFMNSYFQFYLAICQQYLTYSEILKSLEELIKKETEFRSYKNIYQLLTTRNQFMINKILLHAMNEEQLLPQMTQKEVRINRCKELGIVLLVSAEEMDMGRILSFNKQATKQLGFPIDQMTKMSINDLVHQSFREPHTLMLKEQKFQKLQDQGISLEFPYTLFLICKSGYSIIFKLMIQRFNSTQGKKWLLLIEPILKNKPICIMDEDRKILGVNQFCLGFGINSSIIGQQLPITLRNSKLSHQSESGIQYPLKQIKRVVQLQKVINKVGNFIIAQFQIQQTQNQLVKLKPQMKQNINPFYFQRKSKKVLGINNKSREQKEEEPAPINMAQTNNTLNNQLLQQMQQMILHHDKIDYKKNIVLNQYSHQDFPIKQTSKQAKKYKQISKTNFKQHLLQSTSRSRFFTAIIISLMIIVFLGLSIHISWVALYLINLRQQQTQMSSFLLINRQMEYYTYVGIQPLMKNIGQNQSTSSQSKKYMQKIHENWIKLQLLDPNILILLKERTFSSTNGSISGTFDKIIQQNDIFLEAYHQKPTPQLQQKILDYLNTINYGFISITQQISQIYIQQLSQTYNIFHILSSLLIMLILLFTCVIFGLILSIARQNHKIMLIIKQLNSKELQVYIKQLSRIIIQVKFQIKDQPNQIHESYSESRLFRQQFKKTIILQHRTEKNLLKYQEQAKYFSNTKRNINSSDKICSYILLFLMIITSSLTIMSTMHSMKQAGELLSSEITQGLTGNLFKIGPIYIMIEKSILDRNNILMNLYLNKGMDVTQNIDYLYQKGIEKQSYTQEFIEYYDEFWNGKTCALNKIDCYSDLSGSLKQGVSTMVTYLNLQYWQIGKLKNIQPQQMQLRMAKLMKKRNQYLQYFMDILLKQISILIEQQSEKWKQQNIQYFVYVMLIILTYFSLGFIEVYRRIKSVKLTKQILMKIPFQQLININQFNKYFA